MGIQPGLARFHDSDDYIAIFRAYMQPSSKTAPVKLFDMFDASTRKMKTMKGYGFSENLLIKTSVPNFYVGMYEPQNQPTSSTYGFSLGVKSGKDEAGAELSINYSVTHSDLDVIDRCVPNEKVYRMEYDYTPDYYIPFADNGYVRRISNQAGMIAFDSGKSTISLSITCQAKFGAATTSSANALSITHRTWSEYDTWNFKFSVPKLIKEPSQSALRFTERVYFNLLGREPDYSGLQYWALELTKKTISGGELVIKFANEREFRNSNVSNEEFVLRMYQTFMDRSPSTKDSGFQYWVNELKSKRRTRSDVMIEFNNSLEFQNLSKKYGILYRWIYK